MRAIATKLWSMNRIYNGGRRHLEFTSCVNLTSDKNTKKRKQPKVIHNSLFSQTPFPCPTSTKFCTRGHIPDIFLGFKFQKDRLENVGAVGVEILAFPLTRHIASTTACCYRTSRDTCNTVVSECGLRACVCVCNIVLAVACTKLWTAHASTNIAGGQPANALTVDDCKIECIKNGQCTGVDWDQRGHMQGSLQAFYVLDVYWRETYVCMLRER